MGNNEWLLRSLVYLLQYIQFVFEFVNPIASTTDGYPHLRWAGFIDTNFQNPMHRIRIYELLWVTILNLLAQNVETLHGISGIQLILQCDLFAYIFAIKASAVISSSKILWKMKKAPLLFWGF